MCRAYRDLLRDAPPEFGGGLVFLVAPPAPFVPEALRLQPALGVIVAWFGEHARGQSWLDRLRRVSVPAADLVQPMPYCALQSLVDAGMVGRRKEGLTVICFIADPSITDLCDNVCNNLLKRLSNQVKKLGGS